MLFCRGVGLINVEIAKIGETLLVEHESLSDKLGALALSSDQFESKEAYEHETKRLEAIVTRGGWV